MKKADRIDRQKYSLPII